MADPEPTPDSETVEQATPSTEAAPAGEPQAPPQEEFSPAWIDGDADSGNGRSEGYQQTQSQAPQWSPPPPQYQQPPPQPPQPTQQQLTDAQLERFVQNPNGYVDELVNQRMMQTVGPLAGSYQNLERNAVQYMQSQTRSRIDETAPHVERGFKEVLNKDEAFSTNKAVRERTDKALRDMYGEACRSAQGGDFSKLEHFKDPDFYDLVLTAAKRKSKYKPSAKEMESLGRQSVESGAPLRDAQRPEIDPDIRENLRRLGDGAEERYIENIKKHGDRNIWPS